MLSASRRDALLSGHPLIAQKVYAAVPIGEAWGVPAIRDALQNKALEQSYLIACLKDLRDSGLVRESLCGQRYQRTPVRQKTPKPAVEKILTMQKPANTPEKAASPAAPIDLLAELSAEVVALGDEFQKRVRKLSGRIDEVALLVEHDRERTAEQMKDFTQLQNLLKKLG